MAAQLCRGGTRVGRTKGVIQDVVSTMWGMAKCHVLIWQVLWKEANGTMPSGYSAIRGWQAKQTQTSCVENQTKNGRNKESGLKTSRVGD